MVAMSYNEKDRTETDQDQRYAEMLLYYCIDQKVESTTVSSEAFKQMR